MKFDAVLFDCDGVLVDSEAITAAVLRELLGEAGWALTQQECQAIFLGHAVRDRAPLIARHTGRELVTDEWMAAFRHRRDERLAREVRAVPHVQEALAAVQARWSTRMACASGADRPKVEMQLQRTGLHGFFAGRIFSGQELAANKPAPDVYLAAAAALGVTAARCAVVEDSPNGIAAGLAAGATVLGYAPGSDGAALREAGAHQVFGSMQELAALLD